MISMTREEFDQKFKYSCIIQILYLLLRVEKKTSANVQWKGQR